MAPNPARLSFARYVGNRKQFGHSDDISAEAGSEKLAPNISGVNATVLLTLVQQLHLKDYSINTQRTYRNELARCNTMQGKAG